LSLTQLAKGKRHFGIDSNTFERFRKFLNIGMRVRERAEWPTSVTVQGEISCFWRADEMLPGFTASVEERVLRGAGLRLCSAAPSHARSTEKSFSRTYVQRFYVDNGGVGLVLRHAIRARRSDETFKRLLTSRPIPLYTKARQRQG
jgi:hypothetical protein